MDETSNFSPLAQQITSTEVIIYNILLHSDYDTVINYCRTHVGAQRICRDPLFWKVKANVILGIPQQIFEITTLTPAQRYLQLLSQLGGIAYGSERYMDPDQFMVRAIMQNRKDL